MANNGVDTRGSGSQNQEKPIILESIEKIHKYIIFSDIIFITLVGEFNMIIFSYDIFNHCVVIFWGFLHL